VEKNYGVYEIMTEENFEKFIEQLQRKIEYEEEQKYSKEVIYEYRNPNNFGDIKNTDTSGKIKGPCGDTMKISLKINNDIITDAFFWTDGCGATIACGSMITKMVKGISVDKATNITIENLTESLKGLPKEHLHCSKLAIETLKKAIKNYKK
jgi:nitrogen fixation NifU-like protein